MNNASIERNHRILVIDDNLAIHDDFRKILNPGKRAMAVDEEAAALFGKAFVPADMPGFEIDSAHQGREGLNLLRRAHQEGRPYALAFVDVRMPPGWDGVETIMHIWEEDPDVQIVICTAFSDYSWSDMIEKLARTDQLLILKKPFDTIEVRQLACALTEKWSVSRQARRKMDEVERIVEVRTQEIARARDELRGINEQLVAARDAADAASRAKSEFLANMSHEIRTPMAAILGFTENLLESDLTESDRLSAIHTIRRNGEYLLSIINSILDLSRIEAGKMTVERIRCSPCRIVADVASLARVRADGKGLAFNIEYHGVIPETIQTDPTRLRQILINLIDNAIKFSEDGSVRLVTRFVGDGDEPHMQFDVVDTGIGMAEAHKATLFQPFTQADASTTRRYGGTGLGLTISKRLAEALGGDITLVDSQKAVGTHFRATVATGPVNGVKMLDNPMSATLIVGEPAESGARAELSTLKGCHILLAEDGPDNQRLIAHVLKKAGADVVVKEHGALATQAALAARDAGNPFDVILMDMQMPVMDGYEATTLLRQKGYTDPIIALTAHAMAGDRQKCVDAGCDDYATKPIDRKKLVETIRRNLQVKMAIV